MIICFLTAYVIIARNSYNVGVNDVEKKIIEELLKNPILTADKLSLIVKE